MIALIDGDMLLYQASYLSQTKVDFGDGDGETLLIDEDLAVQNAMRLVRNWTKGAGCSRPIVCLSSVKSDNFRHRLYAPYKANRKDVEKPAAYATIRSALEFEYEVYTEANLEADDLMGIGATSEAAQTVIVSGDKDMKTIPDLVFNPSKDSRPVRIRPAQADMNWMFQTMIGDTVDNYPGIPQVGPVNANQILANPHRLRKTVKMVGKKAPKQKVEWVKGEPCSIWQSMVDYAAKQGMSEEELIVQAQVSRILRAGDFDKSTRTVRLWRPSGHTEMKLDD